MTARASWPPHQRLLHLRGPWQDLAAAVSRLADEAQVARGGLGLPGLADRGEGATQGRRRGGLVLAQYGQLELGREVPVVRLAGGDATFDRVRDDRDQRLTPGIRRILQLHQRDRVDSGIGVAPVGLETLAVRVDRVVEQAV